MSHSIFKSIALACILLGSILYTLPNFYGEQPAVQLKAKVGQSLPSDLNQTIQTELTQHKIASHLISTQPNMLLIGFKHTTDQLKAQSILRRALPDLTVALNLASQTPPWLRILGAQPMKLGLDLRGGVHFLLDVDVKSAIQTQLKQDAKTLNTALNEQGFKVIAVRTQPDHHLQIQLPGTALTEALRAQVKKTLPHYTHATTTHQGRLATVSILPLPDHLNQVVEYTLSQTITTLNNRINELGVSEAIIARQGRHYISVDLPGVQDTAQAKALLGKTATLRFHLVNDTLTPHAASINGAPLGSQLYHDESGHPIVLNTEPVLTGDAITYASSTRANGRPAVDIRLGSDALNFHRITQANIGQRLAVLYVNSSIQPAQNGHPRKVIHHERVISVATIQSALGQQFQITGLPNAEYADNLALLLRSGALAAPVSIIEELTVGPSLGQSNIDKGIRSLGVGSLAVILFMLLYYRLFGLIANLALVLNVFLIISTLSLLGATLTLPGIAGIVLTVGMAVDANVLINERIREELRLGTSNLMAIQAGYDRALSTIIDANVTTLIVAMILFTLGSGSVKGFAITLTIGLIASMLTAIVFTRAVVEWIYHRPAHSGAPKRLSIGI